MALISVCRVKAVQKKFNVRPAQSYLGQESARKTLAYGEGARGVTQSH
jgi:hypothetical protein